MTNRFKKDCDAALPDVAFTEQNQAAVRARVAQAGKSRGGRRKYAVLLAVAALMVTGAFATQLVRDNIRQTMTSWEQSHQGTALGISQSDAGYTVTLDEVYGDTRYLYVKGTLSRDDGKPWQVDTAEDKTGAQYAAIGFRNNDFTPPNQQAQKWYGIDITFPSDTDQQDASFDFVVRMEAGEFALTGDATMTLDNVWCRINDVYQEVGGHWAFTFPVEHEDDSELLEVQRSVNTPEGTITLERLRFSALDVSADWSGANETLFSGEGETYLLLKSGDQIPYRSMTSSNADGTEVLMAFAPFNVGLGHISAQDVQAVIYHGQEIVLQ